MNEFLSTLESAKLLGISRIALFRKIKTGQIKAIKVGRNYIIAREEILNLKSGGLTATKKQEIDRGVTRAVTEYGETLKMLKDN